MKKMRKILSMLLLFIFTFALAVSVSAEVNESYVNTVNECKTYLTYLQIFTSAFFSKNDDAPDMIADNIFYYKADEPWQDYESFRNLLLTVMTEEMADINLAYSAKEIDGELYFRYREGSFSDITYDITSDNLEIVHQTKDVIRLQVKLEMDGEEYEAEYIVLKNTEKGWRVAYYGIGTEPYDEWRYQIKGDFAFSDEYLRYRSEDLDGDLIPETADSSYLYYSLAISAFVALIINAAYIGRTTHFSLKETER